MTQELQNVRPFLEALYFVSSIILAFAAVYGLQQIRLMKRDMQIRSDRAAKEKAIEYIGRYFSDYVPLDGTFLKRCEERKLVGCSGPIGAFSIADLPPKQPERARKRYGIGAWLPALNELQTIAGAFAYGIADEKLGFQSIGRTFCTTVATKYDILCVARGNVVTPYYQAIVDLFGLWSPRLTKSELTALRQTVDEKLASLPPDLTNAEV